MQVHAGTQRRTAPAQGRGDVRGVEPGLGPEAGHAPRGLARARPASRPAPGAARRQDRAGAPRRRQRWARRAGDAPPSRALWPRPWVSRTSSVVPLPSPARGSGPAVPRAQSYRRDSRDEQLASSRRRAPAVRGTKTRGPTNTVAHREVYASRDDDAVPMAITVTIKSRKPILNRSSALGRYSEANETKITAKAPAAASRETAPENRSRGTSKHPGYTFPYAHGAHAALPFCLCSGRWGSVDGLFEDDRRPWARHPSIGIILS